MPLLIKVPRPLTDERRREAVAAYNICLEKGFLPWGTEYRFVQNRAGFWGVELWMGDRAAPEGGVAWASIEDLIEASGGHRPVIESLS